MITVRASITQPSSYSNQVDSDSQGDIKTMNTRYETRRTRAPVLPATIHLWDALLTYNMSKQEAKIIQLSSSSHQVDNYPQGDVKTASKMRNEVTRAKTPILPVNIPLQTPVYTLLSTHISRSQSALQHRSKI